ncbi:MAG: transporter substrate-binding domain-containing protein [Oligoflexia bacterium]|nr:transporter substrate-binding domain-containing protein [Oligoflexia bacterium]
MLFFKKFLLTLITPLIIPIVVASEMSKITIVTEDFPPYNFINSTTNKLEGLGVEIVQALLDELNIKTEIQVYPWARAYAMATKDKNILIFSLKRTSDREDLFKWVGEVAKHQVYFFALKSSLILETNNLDDLKKHKVGVIFEGANAKRLESDGFINIEKSKIRGHNWSKLKNKRIDLWFTDFFSVNHILKMAGDSPREVKIIHLHEKLSKDYLYIAFSKQTDDMVVNKFKQAYETIKQNGKINKILEKMGPNQKGS